MVQALNFAIKAVNSAKAELDSMAGDLKHVGSSAETSGGHLKGAGVSVDKLADSASKSHGPLSGMGSALGSVAKIAGGFIVAEGFMKLPGFFMDAAKAAAEDEQSSARLQATIKSLGGDFDAQLTAVNAAIEAGQKLGFTDDETRDSFDKLAIASGSTADAIDRNKVAMDLARGANIDLGTASKLLGKVTDENLQVLKKLGITLPDVANEADVLAGVQKKFAEQSDAYAKSTAGQFAILKDRMGEAKETIGYALIPVMKGLADVLADHVVPMIEAFAKMFQEKAVPAIKDVAKYAGELLALGWDKIQQAWEAIGPILEKAAGWTWKELKDLGGIAWSMMRAAWETMAPILEKIATLTFEGLMAVGTATWDAMATAWGKVSDVLGDLPNKIGDASKAAADASKDTNMWADAWGHVLDVLKFVKPDLSGLGEAIGMVGSATVDLWNQLDSLRRSLAPLDPLLKPLAILIGATLVGAVKILGQVLVGIVTEQIMKVVGAIQTFASGVEALRVTIDTLVPALTTAWDKITTAVVMAKDAIGIAIDAIVDFFTKMPGRITDALGDLSGLLMDAGSALIGTATGATGLFGAIQTAFSLVWTWFNKMGTTIKDFFVDAGTWLFNAGVAIIQGIWDGLKSKFAEMWGWITNKLDPRNWDFPGLSPFLQAYLHVGSLAGEGLGAGIALGISSQVGLINDAAAGAIAAAFGAAAIAIGAGMNDAFPGGAIGGGVNYLPGVTGYGGTPGGGGSTGEYGGLDKGNWTMLDSMWQAMQANPGVGIGSASWAFQQAPGHGAYLTSSKHTGTPTTGWGAGGGAGWDFGGGGSRGGYSMPGTIVNNYIYLDGQEIAAKIVTKKSFA